MNMKALDTDPVLSVVLPAYNDAGALAVFLPDLAAFLGSETGPQEIVVVDDGSRDALAEVCREAAERLPENVRLVLVRLSRNFGKEAALSAGLAQAAGQAVATMDADGQHPVAVLAEMLALYRGGADMVAAIQSAREHESRLARTLKRGFYRFMQDTHHYESMETS